ncbi:MAG TPA: hypothetical protein VF533_15840 [Solirubrobacteraceae bacterium]
MAVLRGGSFPAEGEAHNVSGHADIVVRDGARTILVAECKIWDGASKACAALDQLLGYTTWRDEDIALIFFVASSNIEEIVERATKALREHELVVDAIDTSDVADRAFVVGAPDAPRRRRRLHVYFCHLPGRRRRSRARAPINDHADGREPESAEREMQVPREPGLTIELESPTLASAAGSGGTRIIDPISGVMTIDDRDRLLLDHPRVQLLRSRRASGISYLVYPTAGFSRFNQGLGAMARAAQFVSHLNRVAARSRSFAPLDSLALRWSRASALLSTLSAPPLTGPLELLTRGSTDLERLRDTLVRRTLPGGSLADLLDVLLPTFVSARPSEILPAVLAGNLGAAPPEYAAAIELALGPGGAAELDLVVRNLHGIGTRQAVDIDRLASALVLVETELGWRPAFDARARRGALRLDILHALNSALVSAQHLHHVVMEHRTLSGLNALIERVCATLAATLDESGSRALAERLGDASDEAAVAELASAAAATSSSGQPLAMLIERAFRRRALPTQLLVLGQDALNYSASEAVAAAQPGVAGAQCRREAMEKLESEIGLRPCSLFVSVSRVSEPRLAHAHVLTPDGSGTLADLQELHGGWPSSSYAARPGRVRVYVNPGLVQRGTVGFEVLAGSVRERLVSG